MIAAGAMLFAMVVLVRNEITPDSRYARNQADRGDWQTPTRPIATPLPVRQTPTPAPTPAATPAPSDEEELDLPVDPLNLPPPAELPSLTPATVATPRPANTYKGVVVDDNGTPVLRAQVRVVSGGPDRAAERMVLTDSEGRFTIEGIPDGQLDKVFVEAPGYSTTVLDDVPLPLPEEMMIGMSPLAGIDAVILDFDSGGTEPVLFEGQMQATLLSLRTADQPTTNVLGISEPATISDTYVPVRKQEVVVSEGLLQFDNVEPGRYRLSVQQGQKLAESELLDVSQNTRTSATLILGMKHTVRGMVSADDTGDRLPQARVSLSLALTPIQVADTADYLGFTDENGVFVLPEVTPGRYWLTAGAAGYTTRTLDNFEVLPAAPPEETSITLSKQQPLITVSVVNNENRPMAQAPLALMVAGGPTPKMYFGKTDEAGLHRFDHLTAGRYNLSITAPGDRTRQKTVSIDLAEAEVRELVVRFDSLVTVSGRALVKGKPLKNGAITFVNRGAVIADNLSTTDEDGKFSIDIEPGDYLVRTPDNTVSFPVTIGNDPTQTISVDMK